MFTKVSHLALLAGLLAGLLLNGAVAQTAEAGDEARNLGTITLSATRTATGISRSGVSVTVVERADLEAAGDQQLATYLSRLPGVSLVQSGPMGTVASIRIRGADPRYVAVYIDGIRVDDATGIASEFDFGALSTADIGRVEVLRGSQSALWGGSAVGGVINITSLMPERDGLSQRIAMEGGSHGTAALSYALAYRDQRVEAGFALSHLKSDGFSAYDTLPRSPGLEDDGINTLRLSFNTRYRVSDQLSLGGAVIAQRSRNDFDGWAPRPDRSDYTQEKRELGLRLFAEYEGDTTTHLFEATRYRLSRRVDQGGAVLDYLGVRQGLSYQGTTDLSADFALVYGGSWQEEDVTNAALPAGRTTRQSGVFVQGLWQAAEGLDLSLSLRQDHHSEFGDQPSGRIAVAWQAAPGLTLRGALASGFRSPSHYELYGDPTQTVRPNTGLTPEESRSFEIGADYAFGADSSLSVTLFALQIKDAITWQSCPYDFVTWTCAPGTSNVYENVEGKSKRQGVEIAGNFRITDRIGLDLAYTYLDTEGPTGARLLRVPRHALSIQAHAEVTDQLTAHLGLQHLAGRPAEFGVALADYTLVNAGVSYAVSDALSLSLRVENLFDKDYQSVPGYGTSGRAAYLGLVSRF
ncbi:TonB-dependent receptor [Xinfangfangia sp. D13-10-4-6]|uniref:TonB-dependent receptor plug domain-containing protein n=1 Tax=Pseudogemmobacter hezensis TaxID=2737662 RepID=UPI0015527A3F|nr:TonB-dependent receptor [Pseudogemmobacter hezensis]NPD13734.1 TonB-dependent receptor [Pseudogemmobacter hezensis]